MEAVDRLLEWLRLDPFAYLVVTIFGIIIWVWCSTIGDFAISGRGLWLRRLSLVVAVLGAVFFAYGASRLR
jgi:hypothetical protein